MGSIKVVYKNWRGETRSREVIPIRIESGSTQWHPETQWLLVATDVESGTEKQFALKDCDFLTAGMPVALVAQEPFQALPSPGCSIKAGDIVKFRQVPARHFFASTSMDAIWQPIPSGEVLAHTFAPEFPVMACFKAKPESNWKKGSYTEDYFDNDFLYLGADEAVVNKFVAKFWGDSAQAV